MSKERQLYTSLGSCYNQLLLVSPLVGVEWVSAVFLILEFTSHQHFAVHHSELNS